MVIVMVSDAYLPIHCVDKMIRVNHENTMNLFQSLPPEASLPTHARFSHLSSIPRARVRRIAHVIAAASSRESSNNNANVECLSAGGVVTEELEGFDEEEVVLPTKREVGAFWSMVDAKFKAMAKEAKRQQRQQSKSPAAPRRHLGDELKDGDHRGRALSPPGASMASRSSSVDSPTRNLTEAQELLRRFEQMTSTHKLALQWRETRGFLGQEGTEFVCRRSRDAAHEGEKVR